MAALAGKPHDHVLPTAACWWGGGIIAALHDLIGLGGPGVTVQLTLPALFAGQTLAEPFKCVATAATLEEAQEEACRKAFLFCLCLRPGWVRIHPSTMRDIDQVRTAAAAVLGSPSASGAPAPPEVLPKRAAHPAYVAAASDAEQAEREAEVVHALKQPWKGKPERLRGERLPPNVRGILQQNLKKGTLKRPVYKTPGTP